MMALQTAMPANMREKSESATQQSSEQLETSASALEFYADSDNHKSRNAQPSPVARDNGYRARSSA
jgi:hypothetical protein